LLVATKSDLKNSVNCTTVDANIDAFYEKFAKDGVPRPLFVSAAEEGTLSLVHNELLRRMHANRVVPANAPLDLSILDRLKLIEVKIENRFFKPEASRLDSIGRLQNTLRNCLSVEDIKNTLIEEALFLRSPDANGKLRYGVNIGSTRFKFFVHLFRSYEKSEFYQFLKSELRRIDPKLDLAALSDPKLVARQAPEVASASLSV
jgi:hypothetical protein